MARSLLSRRKRKGLNGRKPSQRFHPCQRHKTVRRVLTIAAATVLALAGQSFEVASIRPPISSTSERQMARPSPVPPKRRRMETSACSKRLSQRKPSITQE